MDLALFLDFVVTALDAVFVAFVAYGSYLALRCGEVRSPGRIDPAQSTTRKETI